MKTTMLTMMIMALLTCFLTTGPVPVMAEPTGSSTMGGGGMPSPEKIPHDKQTDLTPGQAGTHPPLQDHGTVVTPARGVRPPAIYRQPELGHEAVGEGARPQLGDEHRQGAATDSNGAARRGLEDPAAVAAEHRGRRVGVDRHGDR